jgi:hypothetical protein
MTTKIIEGVEYIEKSAVDQIVSSRLNKLAEKLRSAEDNAAQLQAQLDSSATRLTEAEGLAGTVADLRAQLESANSRYDRHSTIAQIGITDPDLRDAVEWQFERSQQNLPKKDRVNLGEWLQNQMASPESAPAVLRPHLQALTQPQQAQQATAEAPASTLASQQPRGEMQATVSPAMAQALNVQAPASNASVMQAPDNSTSADILRRAQTDFDFYRANRDLVKQHARKALGLPAPTKF